jgi:hypothetical protein
MQAMQEIIAKYKMSRVYHFTDKSNFTSISEQKGLLSYAELKRRGIAISSPGGNAWSHDADARMGLDEYVHLALIPNHPMLYTAKKEGRILHPYWLEIDSSILLNDGVLFTKEVANKAGAQKFTAHEAPNNVDFEVLFTRMDWTDSTIKARRMAAQKSQILIPNIVSLNDILGKRDG